MMNPPAVSVQGVTMSYSPPAPCFARKQKNVLKNVDLTIRQSTICCLLGPSGCGKTTLLQCIVGRLALKCGNILIFGHPTGSKESGIPGRRVGYMPQDFALSIDLKVGETLNFYGILYGMTTSQIKSKIQYFTQLLELPPAERLVDTLSGGQKRRLSLCVAFIHDPELLILDEPTVGLDPIIRKRIVEHLQQLTANNGKTILITTHYIEEAAMAHSIGLMYDGTVLCEGSPDDIIERCSSSSLLDAFCKHCVDHDARQTLQWEERGIVDYSVVNVQKSTVCSSGIVDGRQRYSWLDFPQFCHMRAITGFNLKKLYRGVGDLVLHFIIPCIIMTVFHFTFGGFPREVSVAVFDEDKDGLGALYLANIDTGKLDLNNYSSYEKAYLAVRNGDSWGLIHIHSNFTTSLANRFLWVPNGSDADSIDKNTISLAVDSLCQPISITIHEALVEAFLKFGKNLFHKMGWEPSISSFPIQFNYDIYGFDEDGLMGFAAPGIMLCGLYFLAVAHSILSFSSDRRTGVYSRLIVTGITELELLCGLIAAASVGVLFQAVSFLLFSFGILGLSCKGSLFIVFTLLFFHGICGLIFGVFVSVLCTSELTTTNLGFGAVVNSILLTGVIWPVESIPMWFRGFCRLLPHTCVIDALRVVMKRGWGPSHLVVIYGYIGNVTWLFLFFTLAAVIMKYRHS